MQRHRASAPLLLQTLGLVMLAACSGTSSSPVTPSPDAGPPGTPSTDATIGELCSTTAPCGAGLTCAQSGSLLGRCTADCSANLDLCATQFGPSSLCMDASQCALICTGGTPCPGAGQCVSLSSGQSACITNPDGAPDAAPPPNGACANVGGAFGDTVANGGYRCTPTTNGDVGTGIDKCVNGTWTSAYTCTCQVQSDPSDCVDFTAAGTAQCSYAAESCAQCSPTGGCQAQ